MNGVRSAPHGTPRSSTGRSSSSHRHSTFGLESRSLHEPLPVHVTTHTRPRWHGYFRVCPLTTHNRRDASPPPASFRNPVLQSRSSEDYETENAAAELTNQDFDWATATRYQSQSLTRHGDWMSVQIAEPVDVHQHALVGFFHLGHGMGFET
jgi:hypothetical protein